MKLPSPVPHKHARIEIIPLIDIMFFLLASFMMVSLSQTHMKGIRVILPSPVATVQPPDPTVVKIHVASGNATYINRAYVPADQVKPTLLSMYQANPNVKVSISADELALHGDVINVLDAVRDVGIKKVGYAVHATAGAPAGAPAPAAGAPPAGAPPPAAPPPPPH